MFLYVLLDQTGGVVSGLMYGMLFRVDSVFMVMVTIMAWDKARVRVKAHIFVHTVQD